MLTKNKNVLDWVDEMAALTKPDKIVWLDGSEEQLSELRDQAIATGEMERLNEEKLPGCLLHRTAINDVARVEGATGWDTFCKVVFPTVVPYILVNFVYTMIDIFVSYDNAVMRWISDLTLGIQKSYAAAMALSYFLIIMGSIAVILGLVTLFTRARRKGARG